MSVNRLLRGAGRLATGLVACAFALASIVPRATAQDQPVVFVPGLRETNGVWYFIAPTLQHQYQMQAITPDLGSVRLFDDQATSLREVLSLRSGVAAIAHSNGGIVVRDAMNLFGSGAHINRVLTIGTPHRGAALAANALNGNVTAWGHYVAVSIQDPFRFYGAWDPDFPDIVSFTVGNAAGALAYFFDYLGIGLQVIGYAPPFIQNMPVLQEMGPATAKIQGLNAAASLQNEAALTTRRVSISTEVSPTRVPFALLGANPGLLEGTRLGLMGAAVALYYYDDGHPDILLQANAYRWARLFWALYDINAAWQAQIGALLYYNGIQMYYVRNDGVVTWESSDYPGGTDVIRMPGLQGEVLHTRQEFSTLVLLRTKDVVTNFFGIPLRSTGGGGGGGGGGQLAAAISGATVIRPDAVCGYAASVSGGTAPFSYQWYRNGSLVATASEYSDGLNGASSFQLTLRVTDAAGSAIQTEITVTGSTSASVCLTVI